MTMEQQRIALKEACPSVIRSNTKSSGFWADNPEWEWFDGSRWRQCFNNDPLEDLNAIHAVEMWMFESYETLEGAERLSFYTRHLTASEHPLFAKASQRARAFLKTLNLWKS